MPGGLEFYNECLRWHTSLELTPQQVHDIGLAEVGRIRKEMERVSYGKGYEVSWWLVLKQSGLQDNFFNEK
jgi:uncharacterized protein (DUF885 family)